MSNLYQHYLSSAAGTGENLAAHPKDAQAQPQQIATLPGSGGTSMNPYQSMGYYTGFPDPIMIQLPQLPGGRNRRKSAPALDHVKHRRTRSGCYTCRSRRVKCDEGHPVCERCRKGKRECVYPDAPSSKDSVSSTSAKEASATAQGRSPTSSQDGFEDESERDVKMEPILDEEEPEDRSPQRLRCRTSLRRTSTASTLNLQRIGTRHSSETASLEGAKSSSPSVSTGTSVSFATPLNPFHPTIPYAPSDWSHLPADLRFYLDYFYECITHYHYCVPSDPDDFFHAFLPSVAARGGNEALLYAVVGFSAYHYTIRDPNGRIQEFLQYYNKSVTQLLSSFKKREVQHTPTLLAILQLATIEEYLGDWVNLMGHQKAALQILTRLFNPDTVMRSPENRMIQTWYVRFDVFVGMMGGFETRLPREWFSAALAHNENRLAEDPADLSWKTEVCSAALRLVSVDMSILYAKAGRRDISSDAFASEHDRITERLHEWRNTLDPALTDPALCVSDFTHRRPLDEHDIVDPFAEGYLYEHPLFSTTLLLAEWHSIIVMHKSQESLTLQQEPSVELRNLAFAICQIFEAVGTWPSTPQGAMIILQACLAIAALFIPRDAKHHMWVRRKFALIEELGYVFPITMRTRMSEIFHDSSCIQWWLPNDEGLTLVLRSIRTFADERTANPVSHQTESLREMSAIFAKMPLHVDQDGTPSPVEPSSGMASRGRGKDPAY